MYVKRVFSVFDYWNVGGDKAGTRTGGYKPTIPWGA